MQVVIYSRKPFDDDDDDIYPHYRGGGAGLLLMLPCPGARLPCPHPAWRRRPLIKVTLPVR